MSIEKHRVQRRLLELGVEIVASHAIVATAPGEARAACVFTGRERTLPADAAVFVTARLPVDDSCRELLQHRPQCSDTGLRSVTAVGDCWSPGTIAAMWEGRRYAEEFDEPGDRGDTVPFVGEVTELAPDGLREAR